MGPNSDILLTEIVSELKDLSTKGLDVHINNEKVTIYFNLYGMISDSPGKAMLLNMVQFNGYLSCPYCFNPGYFNFKFKLQVI